MAVQPKGQVGGVASDGRVPALSLKGVVKRFGDVVAVDGIDLEIADGEFFSMLGPSGSGKTSTLLMIAASRSHRGHDPPTPGVTRRPLDRTSTPFSRHTPCSRT